MHVLIIEDEVFLALQVQTLLEELGADSTDIAVTQSEAIEAARAHRPDLITSDVQLPEGDGPSAVKGIRAACGDIPAIYITGNPSMVQSIDPSAEVLTKPIRWLDLVTATSHYGLPNSGAPATP